MKDLTPKTVVVIVQNDDVPSTKIKKEIISLSKAGYEVIFLGWSRSLSPRELSDIQIHRELIFVPCSYSSIWVPLMLPIWIIFAVLRIVRLRPDIVHSVDLEGGLVGAIYTMFFKKVFIYDVLDNFYLRYKLPRLLNKLLLKIEEFIYSRANFIILVDKNRITDTEKRFISKIEILYNSPPDVYDIYNQFKNSQRNSEVITIYTNGRLHRNRGIINLLTAASYVQNIKILVAGDVRDKLVAKAMRNYKFVDYRGRLNYQSALQLYFEADAVYSCYEPNVGINLLASSNKVFDAMMSGVPIILNQETAISELVKSHDIGYIFPYYDVEKLKAILLRIKTNKKEALEKGKRGRMLYERFYSWSAMENKLISIYRRASCQTYSRNKC